MYYNPVVSLPAVGQKKWGGGENMSKKVVFLLAWILLPGSAAWAGNCLEGNCQNGRGTFQWADGSKFSGHFASNDPDGEGLYTDPDGNEFHVTYQEGRPVATIPVTREEKELRLKHQEAEKYNAAGLICLGKKDNLSAIFYFNKAISLWPDNQEYNSNYRRAKGLK